MKPKILLIFAQKGEALKTLEKFQASPIEGEMAHIWSEGYLPSLYEFEHGFIALSSMGVIAAQMTVGKYGHKVDEVWNIGMAGRLRGELPIGKLLSVQNVSKYIPITEKDLDARSFETVMGIHPPILLEGETSLISSDFPIHDHDRREFLAKTFDLVDMEGYGIAYASTHLGKKCKMWKIVSDFASPGGRELIKKNKEFLSECIAEHIALELFKRKK